MHLGLQVTQWSHAGKRMNELKLIFQDERIDEEGGKGVNKETTLFKPVLDLTLTGTRMKSFKLS